MTRIVFGFGLALVGASLWGQEEEAPEFPIQTEMVVLDMVVRGADGQPVTDLRPGEVEVFEDGLPCLIESFRLVRPGTPASSGQGTPEASGGAAPVPAAEQASPKEADAPQSPLRPNVVILVFDRLGLEAAREARRAATDFARREFPEDTWFAVYEIGDNVRVHQRFTTNPLALPPAIEKATTGADRSRDPGTSPDRNTLTKEALSAALLASDDPTGVEAVDPVVAATLGQPAGYGERMQRQAEARLGRLADSLDRQRVGGSALRALLSVARELEGMDGRKTLLLFSEGLHVPDVLSDLVETLVSEANRSNLALYAIDPRGLLAEGNFDETRQALLAARSASEKAQRRSDPGTLAETRERQDQELEGSVDPSEVQMHDLALDSLRMNTQANLRDVAEATGGFLLANTNDLSSGIERIGADLRSYYEIGYVPPVPFADGRFRDIQVHVSRSDVQVRTRKGYFARPPSQEPTLQPWELALAQAFDLPTPPRDFSYRVSTELTGVTPEGSEVQLALQVPLRGLHFDYDKAARRYRAHFSVLVLVRGADGSVVSRLSHDWPLEGPLMNAQGVRNQSATVKRILALPPGEYTLESAVGDRLGGGLSVERTPLTVAAVPGAGHPDGEAP
jgi:VWFA-related protein